MAMMTRKRQNRVRLSFDEWNEVFSFLHAPCILRFALVNSTFLHLVRSNHSLWHRLTERDFASDAMSEIGDSGHHMHEIENMNNRLPVVPSTTQSTTGRTAHVQTLLSGVDTMIAEVENSVTMNDADSDNADGVTESGKQPVTGDGDSRYCRCCNGMIRYAWHYVQYAFPFQRVHRADELVSGERIESCKMFFARQDLLSYRVCRVFLHGTKLQLRDNVDVFGVAEFETLNLLSQCPTAVPDLAIRLWTILHSYRFTSLARVYFRSTLCLVIAVYLPDARVGYDDAYCSLYDAIRVLREAKSMLTLSPPKACQCVIVIGVGEWPTASTSATITKEQFLKDCTEAFDILPIEYYEMTEDNSIDVANTILKRVYMCHRVSKRKDMEYHRQWQEQQAQKEVTMTAKNSGNHEESASSTGSCCIS